MERAIWYRICFSRIPLQDRYQEIGNENREKFMPDLHSNRPGELVFMLKDQSSTGIAIIQARAGTEQASSRVFTLSIASFLC